MALSVKPRAGGKSAQLVMSVLSKRVNRRLRVSVGSVSKDADLSTGTGLRLKSGYSLASLSSDDLARIRAWLDVPLGAAPPRVTLDDLSAKLDRLLAAAAEPTPLTSRSSGGRALTSADALAALEDALAQALQALEAAVERQLTAGVKLSRRAHIGTSPVCPGNQLDELQAWSNRMRFEMFEELRATCQRLGLWKSQGVAGVDARNREIRERT